MDKVVLFLARGCGSGLLRPAPGTWGSAAALLYYHNYNTNKPSFVKKTKDGFSLYKNMQSK